uniref:Hemoglobinase n=1 Tax=Schistosoma japonicum TaxID=6182 RepID=C1LDJ6_SCHJA|nr:legumain [Schistosoma japonicum]
MFYSIFFIHILCIVLVDCNEYSEENVDDRHKWAVLVAGSNGFENYRHQADVCHAYHVLLSKGVKPEHIITFMYDDIAHNKENPFPGKIFNDYRHKDYYKGVVIDYKGKKVNPKTFLQVLKGDKRAGGKVLKSGKNDDVFIYFTDHGAPGILAFPDDDLHAKPFINTLKYLRQHRRYSKLVIYVEACESGSMFAGLLPTDINIYATTAARPDESSYATFCDDPRISSCLADLYSYDWIVDLEKHQLTQRTLDQQYKEVKFETNLSHVQRYGDKKMGKLYLSEFQGSRKKASTEHDEPPMKPKDSIPSRDIPLHTLHRRIMMANNMNDKNLLMKILGLKLKRRDLIKDTMELIEQFMFNVKQPNSNATIDETMDCIEVVYKEFQSKCFKIQQAPEITGYLSTLYNYCQKGYSAENINEVIMKVCG